jgi:hypothetical protein
MPRAAISLALLLAATSLQGCAEHRRAPHAHASAPASATEGSLTRSRALAFAHAVNLTAADVPGFSPSRSARAGPGPHKRAEGELFACAGARGSSARIGASDLANASSPSFAFRRGIVDLGVTSEIGVARSSALADAELAALHSGRLRTCFERYLRSILTAGRARGTNIGRVTIESGNPPAPGTSGSFGWRVRATFGLERLKVPVYLDLLGFVYGPARVTLVSSGALRPFPALAQQRLFGLLLRRARAHAL